MSVMSLPAGPAGVTPAWLTEALRVGNHLDGQSVTAVTADPVGQGVGILCQLFRLTLTYDQPPPKAPRTLIAKLPSPQPETRQMVAAFHFYEREVSFYAELGGKVTLSTPKCYFHAFDAATGDFVLLLEDLGSARLGDQLAGCAPDDAKVVVAQLAAFHAEWWDSPRLAGLTWMPTASAPIQKAGMMLYPMAWPSFVERFGDTTPPELMRIGQELPARFDAILDRFGDTSRTICHGDYRLDNLFFAAQPSEPPLRVIDWQIAHRGVGAYDMAYFISQSLTVENRRASEMELLRMYHEVMTERGAANYSFDQLLADYRWATLFCFAYPVMGGGLGDLANARGMALGHAMMERSSAAILDWKAGDLLKEFD